MSIVRWNPLREMATLHEDMNRLFSRFDGGEVAGRQSWMLSMDVIEGKDEIKLKAALPGLDPKDINVQVEDNVLTVSGQRNFEEKVEEGDYYWVEQQYGSFSRSVTLPKAADTTQIKASYQNGVLELVVPKRAESKPRKIELNLGGTEPRAIEANAQDSTPPAQ
ncbi:MAG: Hsp20/alpha crystallin family protein [Abitibacteriaceae bacterium]|nr:Hsp20/alpha crystallin family protein [Abditibacteriaceae bacterium]MBV9864929.1 Hsp20/alpha crystallin family protein [Abditibacteriaceae bacterium]